MNELRIHTKIHSRYQVFDASGQLPFSIVFGLCRRPTADTDSRPLLLETAGSVLDVPYALAHGLLTLHERESTNGPLSVEVDLRRLGKVAANHEAGCIALSSPVNGTEQWRDAFTIYLCHIDIHGELASILEPRKYYVIRLASEDLGVKRWAYSDGTQSADHDRQPSHDSEPVKLINSKTTGGNAAFKVVESLSWPPIINLKMRLCTSKSTTNAHQSNVTVLEVRATNTGSDTVTVQTSGHQHFLTPWGPFDPEPDALDDRMRIIDASPHKPPTSSLQIIDSVTGEVVRKNEQRGTGLLTDSNVNRQPKLENSVTLKPGEPVVREVDIRALVDGLDDGQYKIRMQPKGCRWWPVNVKMEAEENRSVSLSSRPPLMLESQDEVELHIRDGKIL